MPTSDTDFTSPEAVETMAFIDYLESIQDPKTGAFVVAFEDWDPGCECEIDWRCGHHRNQPTWLETRFEGLDDEARYDAPTEWGWAGAA